MVRSASVCRPAWYCASGEQVPATFAHRRRLDHALGHRQHLQVAAGAQAGVDAQFLGLQPQLVQPGRPRSRQGPRTRRPRTARPRHSSSACGQQVGGALGLAQRQQLAAALPTIRSKLPEVDVVGRHDQPITLRGSSRSRPRPAPCAAAPRTLAGPCVTDGRRLIAPDRVGELVRADRPADAHRECGQHGRSRRPNEPSRCRSSSGPSTPMPTSSTFGALGRTVNAGVTAAIPGEVQLRPPSYRSGTDRCDNEGTHRRGAPRPIKEFR